MMINGAFQVTHGDRRITLSKEQQRSDLTIYNDFTTFRNLLM